MVKCVDMPIVHIKISVCGKLYILLYSNTPLLDGRIELMGHINFKLLQ